MAPFPRPPTSEEMKHVLDAAAELVKVAIPVATVTAPLVATAVRAVKEAIEDVFGDETKTIHELLQSIVAHQASIAGHQAALDALVKRVLVQLSTVDHTPHGTKVPT